MNGNGFCKDRVVSGSRTSEANEEDWSNQPSTEGLGEGVKSRSILSPKRASTEMGGKKKETLKKKESRGAAISGGRAFLSLQSMEGQAAGILHEDGRLKGWQAAHRSEVSHHISSKVPASELEKACASPGKRRCGREGGGNQRTISNKGHFGIRAKGEI